MATTSSDELLAATRDLLITHGPTGEGELRQELLASGHTLGAEEEWFEDLLMDTDPPVMPIAGDRWVWLPAVLEGRTLTHRLSEDEVKHDVVVLTPDLAPVETLIGDAPHDRFTDGSDALVVYPPDDELDDRGIDEHALDSGVLLLERGRLAGLGVGAGDIVGLRVEPDGLELLRVEEALGTATGQAVAALVQASPDRPHLIENSVWTACAADAGLLRSPELPLGEQLAACGVTSSGSLIGADDFDIDAWQADDLLQRMREDHDLDEREAGAVMALLQIVASMTYELDGAMEADDDAREAAVHDVLVAWVGEQGAARAPQDERPKGLGEEVGPAVALLRDPVVAAAFLDEALGELGGEPVVLAALTAAWEPEAPRSARVALRWLQGMAAEEMGNILGAEELFQQAESLDPSWSPALMSLALCASDRGDAVGGMSLLRRAGAEDEPLYDFLQQFLPGQGRDIPRNAPCWCGSGKKFKQCHLRQTQRPLAERANWLYQKAAGYLVEKDTPFLLDLGEARAQHWDGTDGLDRALSEGLIIDVALWEGGVLAEYLERRGALLPPDELELAQEWLQTRRSVHEVASAVPGGSIALRDLRTGEVAEVPEPEWSRRVKPGEHYCTRVASLVDGVGVFGGLALVAPAEVEPLMSLLDEGEPDPVGLVEFLSRPHS